MTSLPAVADYLATLLATTASGALAAWEYRGEMSAPPELTERTAVVELLSSRELCAGNMTLRVEGQIVASGGGDSLATTAKLAAELRQLMQHAAAQLPSLTGSTVALAGGDCLFYRVTLGQQTVTRSADFAQLLTVLPFTLFLQL